MTAFALVHSPLVGPTTWSAVADELRTRGHEAAVPSLLDAAQAGDHRRVIEVAARAADGVDVLVAHSGAGLLLPSIAAGLTRPPRTLVFVDAGLPPDSGVLRLLPDDLLVAIRPRAVDGRLPPWSEWFGAGAVDALLPDPATREAVVAELPRLPIRYFDGRVTVPDGWTRRAHVGYVLLSAPYADDARRAAARGWPVREIASTHLGIVTDAPRVTDAILDVAAPRDR